MSDVNKRYNTGMDAVIFDMDGVISDTERLHGIAESEMLAGYGIRVTVQEMSDRFAGVPEKNVWEILFREHGIAPPPQKTLADTKFALLSTISMNNVQAIPGSIELIKELKDARIPCGIASSSRHEFIDIVTNELKIRDWFNVICSGTEVKNGKPAPDIFLFTAKKLKVAPNQCIVIEDASSGVTAAKAAGMMCIGFKPASSGQDLSMADVVVTDLREINLDRLRSM